MDQGQTNRTLSEISHLFLSEVRERQTGGAPRPTRLSPSMRAARAAAASAEDARPGVSIDMTPEEFAAQQATAAPMDLLASGQKQVSALLAAHLGDRQDVHVKAYAKHLASKHGRVGLISLDGCEFSLSCFDPQADDDAAIEPEEIEALDERRMAEAIEEMSFDVDRWLLVLPNARTTEARELLRHAPHWVLLSTADHDGVVASYRTLKGLTDVARPSLSLAVLGARDAREADAVFRKLASVSRQFLDCPLDPEPRVQPAGDVVEHAVLRCRETHDKATLATAPQWKVVAEFLAAAVAPARDVPAEAAEPFEPNEESHDQYPPATAHDSRHFIGDVVVPTDRADAKPEPKTPAQEPMPMNTIETPSAAATTAAEPTSSFAPRPPFEPAPLRMTSGPDASDAGEVIDLPAADASAPAVLDAVLRQAGDLVPSPVKAPACPGAVVAVGRDQRLTLVAVAGKGLGDLRSIGLAYRWMTENRALIRMALPQFAFDATAMPSLRLLVDHSDLSADLLQPMLQTGTITVQAYRKLKWGAKTGLLLEAA